MSSWKWVIYLCTAMLLATYGHSIKLSCLFSWKVRGCLNVGITKIQCCLKVGEAASCSCVPAKMVAKPEDLLWTNTAKPEDTGFQHRALCLVYCHVQEISFLQSYQGEEPRSQREDVVKHKRKEMTKPFHCIIHSVYSIIYIIHIVY